MSNSLGSPTKREMLGYGIKITGLFFVVPILMVGLATYLFLFVEWKTAVAEVKLPGHGSLEVAMTEDWDISTQYFVRVRGGEEELRDWTFIASVFGSPKNVETSVDASGRYAGASFIVEDDEFVVIYDSKDAEVWWLPGGRHSISQNTHGWELLYAQNPRFAEPPQ